MLIVKYSDHVVRKGQGWRPRQNTFLAVWYIFVSHGKKWEASEHLRFVRQKDAELAATALRLAGLDNYRALCKADLEDVRQIAYSALQW